MASRSVADYASGSQEPVSSVRSLVAGSFIRKRASKLTARSINLLPPSANRVFNYNLSARVHWMVAGNKKKLVWRTALFQLPIKTHWGYWFKIITHNNKVNHKLHHVNFFSSNKKQNRNIKTKRLWQLSFNLFVIFRHTFSSNLIQH